MDAQARILHSDTARKVLNAPKESLRTAKQTLENCQENLQTLGNLLHKTVAQAQSVHVQTRMIALEVEAVSRPVRSMHHQSMRLLWKSNVKFCQSEGEHRMRV